MALETIRVAIIGAGRNTVNRHIPGLLAQEEVQITGVCNRSRESSQQVADRFEIPNVYDNWRQLIEAGNNDAVVIGTWPYLHKPAAVAALQAGKHVLCEARMAMNLAEAREMAEVARQRPHLVAQVVPAPMTLEVDATITRLLADNYLGDLLAIEVRQQQGFIDREAPLHWRENRDLSGLNVMTLGIWYEIVLRWVGEASTVMAMGQTFVRTRVDEESGRRKAIQIPDHLVVSATMACGAQATFLISSVTGNAPASGITLYGSKATLQFSNGVLAGGGRGDGGLQPITIPAEERSGWRVEEEFINAIRGKEAVQLTTFGDGVKYMAFTEAVARSLAEGCAVMVSY